MTSRERIKTIVSGREPDRSGFWLGIPHTDTWPIYLKHFQMDTEEQVRQHLGDDFYWICSEWGTYKHPESRPLFDWAMVGKSGEQEAVFADCLDVKDVEAYDWPSIEHLDFTPTLDALRNAGDIYRASGMMCCFFHVVAAYFGMENYFVKMHTDPDVVDAVTRHVCEFYLSANDKFFRMAGGEVDGFFFFNDYGTQCDLLVSPDAFDRFILPYTAKLIEQGHSYGHQVMTHSCGAVHKIIGRLIDAGIDALHPLQAKATGMDAESLGRDFKGKVAFIGGIDTQYLLVSGTPQEIKDEVRRVRGVLGPNLVVSPSHETLLPNVPPENVAAMAEAALES